MYICVLGVLVSSILCLCHAELGCTEQYALQSRDEPITFLERLLQPIAFEKFLVDVLQKQPAVARRRNPNFYGTLLDVNDIDTVLRKGKQLHNPTQSLSYGKDWKLVKRTERKGELWTGVFNKANMSLDVAQEAFNNGGFSLIIHGVQGMWANVYRTAWYIEAALGWRGFEAHYDWMDGIILQLKGAKKWTIYDPPFALFPRPDHVRRPTSEFLKHAKQNGPQEFVLNAGDMVYIPRGVVHEATTNLSVIDSAVAGESSNEKTGTDTPKENSPSLHLTYGLETATHYTTEILLHHFISSRAAELGDIPFQKWIGGDSNSVTDLTLVSDAGLFRISCGRGSTDVYGVGSGILVRDVLHAFLSAIASSNTQKPILRMALAVTDITLAVPTMHPLNALPASLQDVLDGVKMSAILQFLVLRGILSITFEGGSTPSKSMIPSSQTADTLYHSADFTCTYLNRFFSDGFMRRGRLVDLKVQSQLDNPDGDITSMHSSDWQQYKWVSNSEDASGSEETIFYDRQKVVSTLLTRDTWVGAEESLRRIFLGIFTSLSAEQELHAETYDTSFATGKTWQYAESTEYCDAWKRMMDDIREEKKSRQVHD